jgi:hypothetical protein
MQDLILDVSLYLSMRRRPQAQSVVEKNARSIKVQHHLFWPELAPFPSTWLEKSLLSSLLLPFRSACIDAHSPTSPSAIDLYGRCNALIYTCQALIQLLEV